MISDNKAAGTINSADGTITYTFTFSQNVTGFTADDITVLNGSKGRFAALSAKVYTLAVTPDAGEEGNITVNVAAGVAVDANANPSRAAAQAVQGFDTRSPLVVINSSFGKHKVLIRDGQLSGPILLPENDQAPLQINITTPAADGANAGKSTLALPLDLLIPRAQDANASPALELTLMQRNRDGVSTPLLYQDRTNQGASFYDLKGDGKADTVVIKLSAGDALDQQPQTEQIQLQIVPKFLPATTAIAVGKAGDLILGHATASMNSTPVNLNLRLTRSSYNAEQIGYVVIDRQDPAGQDPTKWSLATLRNRARRLFEPLQPSRSTQTAAGTLQRNLQLNSSQRVFVFSMKRGSLDDLFSPSKSSKRQQWRSVQPSVSWLKATASKISGNIQIRTPGGSAITAQKATTAAGLNPLIAAEQSRTPLLDFRMTALLDKPVTATMALTGASKAKPLFGFYRVVDVEGRVRDPRSGKLLDPGHPRYLSAALDPSNRAGIFDQVLPSSTNRNSKNKTIQVTENGLLAPFASFKQQTYFAYAAANSDNRTHIRLVGENVFSVEESVGVGRHGFNDIVFSFVAHQPGSAAAAVIPPFGATTPTRSPFNPLPTMNRLAARLVAKLKQI